MNNDVPETAIDAQIDKSVEKLVALLTRMVIQDARQNQ